jgi:hypothetical protein
MTTTDKTIIASGARLDTIGTRGAYTIRRDEIRFGGLRVAWTVNGPGVKERSFSTRRAARAFVASDLRRLDPREES